MGPGTSQCDSSKILNIRARLFFDDLRKIENGFPQLLRESGDCQKFVGIIYDSMKKVPESEDKFGVIISGKNTGPMFFTNFSMRMTFPHYITKVSFRKSGINEFFGSHLASFIKGAPNLTQLDISENNFGKSIHMIISSVTVHPNLNSLIIEDSNLQENVVTSVCNLINFSRKITSLRVDLPKLSPPSTESIKNSLRTNTTITVISLSKKLKDLTNEVTERNKLVSSIYTTISDMPFSKPKGPVIEAFKSVKGREMMAGRARMKENERTKGSSLFQVINEADNKSISLPDTEDNESLNHIRYARAEMMGRRPKMEDAIITLKSVPVPNGIMFGIFDGHGGREAADYAAENLPVKIGECLAQSNNVHNAYTTAFQSLQNQMKQWCVYVGTTSVVATLIGNQLTVANAGDSRCVLCRDGKAERLTIDHKPDLPEEADYIRSKGSYVADGRIAGMLAVSRALGDGFLGDAVNPTPHFVQVSLLPTDSFMILACDGVWDVISDQEAVDIVLPEVDPLTAAMKLRDEAYNRFSMDNISVVVVFLVNPCRND